MRYFLLLLALVGLIGLPILTASRITSSTVVSAVPQNQVNACKLGGGSDIGYLINQADATLGASAGEILVPCSGPLRTQVVLSPNRTLRLGPGTYPSEVRVNGVGAPAILVRDNTVIAGNGWNTVLVESSLDPETSHIMIESYNDTLDHYNPGANGLTIKDLKILGNPSARFNSVVQAISLGNARNVNISNVYIEDTRAMGIGIGGTNGTGNYADGVWVTNCLFRGISSQNIAVINAKNFHIESNAFVNGGNVGAGFFDYIDIETNVPNDFAENFTISNNTFDSRQSLVWNDAIVVQSQNNNAALIGPGVISNNTVVGGDYDPLEVTNKMTSGIVLIRTRDILVTGNNIRRLGQSAIALYDSTRIQVSNNRLQSVGGGGTNGVIIAGTTYSQFMGNSLTAPNVPGSSSNGVVEYGASDFNVFFNNVIGLLYETPGSYGIDQGFTTVGLNSKVMNNVIAGKLQL